MIDLTKFDLYETEVKGTKIYIRKNEFLIYFYIGNKKRPYAKRFDNEMAMLIYIDDLLKKQFDKNKKKAEEKIQDDLMKKEARAKVKIGDLFATSWGYDRTIVSFFEVISRPSPATVEIREISSEMVSGNFMSGRVKPVKGDFISEPKRCQINKYGHVVKADEYGHNAYQTTENSTHHVSSD